MIVTEGGKNIYPEDIESVFDGLAVKTLWPQKTVGKEMLVLVIRLEQNQQFDEALREEVASNWCCLLPSSRFPAAPPLTFRVSAPRS